MKKEQRHLWIEGGISVSTGLTPVVIDYISGKRKSLPKGLTWGEFILIWDLQKELFEKTSFFKERVAPYRSMKKNHTGHNLMLDVHQVIFLRPSTRDFFLENLPAHFAMGLCKTVFEYKKQFERTTDKGDKVTILSSIAKLTAKHSFSKYELQAYIEMTKGVENFDFLAQVMVNTFINSYPKEGLNLVLEIPVTDDQLAAVCRKIDEDPKLVNVYDLLRLYDKYPRQVVKDIIAKQFADDQEKERTAEHLFENIQSMFRVDSRDEVRERNIKIYPLLQIIIPSLKLDGNSLHYLMNLMPEYVSHSDIDNLLDRVFGIYEKKEYGLMFDNFMMYYNYCPQRKKSWLDLYIKNIIYHGGGAFKEYLEVYKLTKDIRVIETVIDHQFPKLESVSEDFATFFQWLFENHTDLYNKVYQQISEGGYLEKWWLKIQGYQNYNKMAFIKFSTHFA